MPVEETLSLPPRRVWARRIVIAALLVAVGYAIIGIVERVDWASAWEALTSITWWELAILFAILVVRQTLNAGPLTLFIPGLSIYRAALSDQAATLVSMVAPPPSDMVLRLKIFASWGIDLSRGLAGSTMNVLAFYTNRLLVPIVGFVLLLVADESPGYLVPALICLGAGLTLLVVLRTAVHDPAAARGIGERVGRLVVRFKEDVSPAGWGEKMVEFRSHIADRFGYAMPRSLLLLFLMTLVDSIILVLALRFVGVPASDLPISVIVGGFLLWYPLTMTPLQGLGILDAVLVAMYTAYAGQHDEAAILAGLLIYRVVTLGGPILLGLCALGLWRRSLSADSTAIDGPPVG